MTPEDRATQEATGQEGITMSRCTGCGAIGMPGARVHACWTERNEWAERVADHYEPTELVDFALIEGSARTHDDALAEGRSQA